MTERIARRLQPVFRIIMHHQTEASMFEGALMWADIAIVLGAANTVVIEKWGTIVSGSRPSAASTSSASRPSRSARSGPFGVVVLYIGGWTNRDLYAEAATEPSARAGGCSTICPRSR
ncbi:hypothetical protein [Sphingomonas panni]|uniref:hypothetical protein n=1 Tax=Sphingomonas panni TaxID=237612 RepID=UPI001F5BE682|nr:hypothetical protein [Sphingomonas panni]